MANFEINDFDGFDNIDNFEDRDFDDAIYSVSGGRRCAGPDANDVYGDFE